VEKDENGAVWLQPSARWRRRRRRPSAKLGALRYRSYPILSFQGDLAMPPSSIDNAKLDRIVADARRNAEQRDLGYRERALKMYPWICGRCAREFTRANLPELTVHHRNHDHDYNPADGSNWELLCVYCHDNEHSRHIDHVRGGVMEVQDAPAATGNPFADLKAMLERGKKS
jgi:5-methylcytosine-specific restriction endonuclease McrA